MIEELGTVNLLTRYSGWWLVLENKKLRGKIQGPPPGKGCKKCDAMGSYPVQIRKPTRHDDGYDLIICSECLGNGRNDTCKHCEGTGKNENTY